MFICLFQEIYQIPVRFTSLFLIINYIYNVYLVNMESTPTETVVAMRYVLLIDEAHDIFHSIKIY